MFAHIRLTILLHLAPVEHSNLEYLERKGVISVISGKQIIFLAWKQNHDLWDVEPCSVVTVHGILEEHAASTFGIEEKTEH